MGDDALARCIASFSTLRQFTAPGELWAYCSSGFMLAGRVVEVATGKPFETAMRERIFEPLGLDHSFCFAHEAIVYPTAAGHSLNSRLKCFARKILSPLSSNERRSSFAAESTAEIGFGSNRAQPVKTSVAIKN